MRLALAGFIANLAVCAMDPCCESDESPAQPQISCACQSRIPVGSPVEVLASAARPQFIVAAPGVAVSSGYDEGLLRPPIGRA